MSYLKVVHVLLPII